MSPSLWLVTHALVTSIPSKNRPFERSFEQCFDNPILAVATIFLNSGG
jgi:hypothetical protein